MSSFSENEIIEEYIISINSSINDIKEFNSYSMAINSIILGVILGFIFIRKIL